MIWSATLVFLMQLGFAQLEAGMCRPKNVITTYVKAVSPEAARSMGGGKELGGQIVEKTGGNKMERWVEIKSAEQSWHSGAKAQTLFWSLESLYSISAHTPDRRIFHRMFCLIVNVFPVCL